MIKLNKLLLIVCLVLFSAATMIGCGDSPGGGGSKPTEDTGSYEALPEDNYGGDESPEASTDDLDHTQINGDVEDAVVLPEDSGAGDQVGETPTIGTDTDPGDPADTELTETPDAVLVFGGDVMLDRNVEAAVKKYGGGNYSYPFQKIADYLKSADLVFANLESIISDKGFINLTKLWPWFRAEPEAALGLKEAGFDIVSLANNHIFDYGRTGMEDCFRQLHSAGIKYCGAGLTHEEAYGPVVMDVNGIKIAFLAYTNHGSPYWRAMAEYSPLSELLEAQAILGGDQSKSSEDYLEGIVQDGALDELFKTPACSGVAWLFIKQLERGIYAAREIADIVVVSFHFGADYETIPSSAQDRYAHLAIDRGADLVVGHSPHVPQPVVKYSGGYIAYSLGNFVFDQRESYNPVGIRSILLEVGVKNKKISSVTTKNIKIVEGAWVTEFEQP